MTSSPTHILTTDAVEQENLRFRTGSYFFQLVYQRSPPTIRAENFNYADDMALEFQNKPFSHLEEVLSSDFIKLSDYCKKWRSTVSI